MAARDDFADALGAMLPRLRRFAFSLSRSAADADDLAAQAVERALRSRSQFTLGTRLDSWLFRITRNLWIDEGRPVPGQVERSIANLRDVAPTIRFDVPRGSIVAQINVDMIGRPFVDQKALSLPLSLLRIDSK